MSEENKIDEKDKLVWLGLVRAQQDLSEIKEEIERLRETFGDIDDFQDGLDEIDTWEEFEQYLIDNGWSGEEAERFRQKLQLQWENWGDAQDVLLDLDGFEELKEFFDTRLTFESDETTEDGQPIAGIRIHDTGGVSYSGVSLPAGTIEIYGERIEFSQTGPPDPREENIFYSNLEVSNTTPVPYETVTISATVTNDGNRSGSVYVPLLENGSKVDSKNVTLDADQLTTVEFERTYEDFQSVNVTIGDLPEETITVVHPGLVQ